MNIKYLPFLVIVFLFVACATYKPFSNIKEKRKAKGNIKVTFELTNSEFNLIKKDDSILFEIDESIKKRVKLPTINRRLDSFFKGSYDKEKLLLALEIDQLKWGDFDFEKQSEKTNKYPKFKNVKELKEFLKNFDTIFKPKVKIDTVKN